MKKSTFFYFFSLFIFALLASCSSDDEKTTLNNEGDSTKKREVIVNVKGFDTEVLNLKSAFASDSLSMEYYVLVKLPGKWAPVTKKAKYWHASLGFSDIEFREELPVGDYVIVISGITPCPPYREGYEREEEYPVPADDYLDEQRVYHANNQTEAFVGTVEFSVTESSPASIKTNLTLSRVVGKVEVVINDAKNMPASMTTLTSHVSGFVPRFYWMSKGKSLYFPDPDISYWNTDVEASRADITANDEYVFSFYMLTNVDVLGYNVDILDYEEPSPEVIKTDLYMVGDNGFNVKIKDGLKVYKNKITRLTGSLFGGAGLTGISPSVSIESKWDSEVIEESF